MKYIALLIILTSLGFASADYTVGPNLAGSEWTGNSSGVDTTRVVATENVELQTAVADYYLRYRFDEGSGETVHDENSSNPSVTVTCGAIWASGKYGNGLEFNGTNYIQVAYMNGTTPSNGITVLAYANLSSTSAEGIVHQRNAADAYRYGLDAYSGSARANLRLAGIFYQPAYAINTNTIYHLANRYDNETITLFIDGVNRSYDASPSGALSAMTADLYIGSYPGTWYCNGILDEIRIYFRALSNSEINQTRDNDHETSGNLTSWHDAGSGQETYNLIINCTTPANTNYTVYYRSNNTGNYVSLASAQTGNQTISISGTKHQNTDVRVKLLGNTSQTPELFGITFETQASGAAGGAPSITSHAPTGTIWKEVADTQLFNITVNQSTYCTWYVNGSQVQYNGTPSLTHAYTNTSLNGGGCNVTAVCNNTNGSDSQTWLFEVGADSVSYIVLQDTPTNQSMIAEWNITRIGSNVTDWGRWQNHTFDGWNYTFRYTNGTAIKSRTASSDNESLWFNHTSLLPTGVYFINATSTAPVITNLTNSTPQTTSVTITWDTDISSNNRVYYGTNETEINAWTNGTWSSWHNATTSISIGLSGLSANTTYYYKPESRDVAINQSVAAENFTTAESTGIETFVNPSFISTGAAAILFVAAAGRFAISAWRNRRRKRRN